MMAGNLIPAPPTFNLVLSKGGGLGIDFVNQPGGVATPYTTTFGNDVTVTLIIDASTPISQSAVITAEHAVVKIEPTVTDGIKAFLLWRLVISSTIADPPVVPCNGTTVRSDGN